MPCGNPASRTIPRNRHSGPTLDPIRAGIEPQTVSMNGDDPVALVVSLNVKRRNLTASQRAIAAAEACQIFDRSARSIAPEFEISHDFAAKARKLLDRDPPAAEAVNPGATLRSNGTPRVRSAVGAGAALRPRPAVVRRRDRLRLGGAFGGRAAGADRGTAGFARRRSRTPAPGGSKGRHRGPRLPRRSRRQVEASARGRAAADQAAGRQGRVPLIAVSAPVHDNGPPKRAAASNDPPSKAECENRTSPRLRRLGSKLRKPGRRRSDRASKGFSVRLAPRSSRFEGPGA